jgi:hypothetical protein
VLVAALEGVIAEQRAMRRDLANVLAEIGRLRLALEPGDEADARLVAAIAATVGDAAFTSRELVRHADAGLGSALEGADLVSPREVGWCLRRLRGIVVDGFRLERVGTDRDGIVWRVLRVSQEEPAPVDT